jgi:hypothetical protein
MANNLLKEKFGESGSSNRLFKHCKTCNSNKQCCQTPKGARDRSQSFDAGLTRQQTYTSPRVSHSIDIDADMGLSHQYSRRLFHTAHRSFKMPKRRRPTSAVVAPCGTSAYLES